MRASLIGFIQKVCPGFRPHHGIRVGTDFLPGRPNWFAAHCSLLFACMIGVVEAQTNDPTITMQPVGGSAAVGETFALSVSAGGTVPIAYQWYFNNATISAATNSTLLLTNLATGDAGNYFAVVTNNVGTSTSSVADLFVVTTAPRVVWVKDVAASGSNTADVPLVLNANGRESAVQFSLRFDTNTFNVLSYEWQSDNVVSVNASNAPLGELGFTVSRPPPGMFPAGQQTLGFIRFSLLGTNTTVLDGGLTFTNQPLAIQAVDTNGLEMLLSGVVAPQVEVSPEQPELNRQTGLFEQVVSIANPSGTTFVNLPVYVPSLGMDTSTNAIHLWNASGTASVDLDGDGVFESAAFVTVTNLPPGAVGIVTNGFYVADHATLPVADYYVGVGGTPGVPMPATTVPLRITAVEWEPAGLAIEWSTRPDRVYSVQYAETLADLEDPGSVETSTNTVIGTGSPARWVDDGSVVEKRFYQVVESK